MSIWDDIGSFLSNTAHDVFGGSNQGAPTQPQPQQGGPQIQVQAPQATPMVQVQQTPQAAIAQTMQNQQDQQNQITNPLNNLISGQAKQTPQTQVPVQQPQNQHASIFHDITHNPATNVVGGLAKGVVQGAANMGEYFGKNDIIDPVKQTVAQVTGNQKAYNSNFQQQNQDMGLGKSGTNIKGGVEKLAGNTAEAASFLIPGGAEGAESLGAKVATTAAKNALAGGVYGAGNAMANEGNIKQIAKSSGENALFGGALGAGGELLHGSTPVISKALHKLPDSIRTGFLKTAAQAKPVQTLPIDQLHDYEGETPDPVRVNQYKNAITSGQPIDPLLVVKDKDGNLGVEDGKHRLAAYQQLGVKNVPAKIVTPEDLKKISEGGYASLPGSSGEPVENAAIDRTKAKIGPLSGKSGQLSSGPKDSLDNNTKEAEILKHYTTPDVAQKLQNGAEFNYKATPQHGMGGRGALLPSAAKGGDMTGKFVNDGGPALYLSRDDPTWSKANVPTGKPEIVNIDNVTPEQMQDGYFQKNGITPQFDYAQQKYVGVKTATAIKQVNLTPVEHQLDPNAKTLNIDSPASLQKVVKQVGTTPEQPRFWSALRNKYDIVNITNVSKSLKTAEIDSGAEKFFRSAKADQAIVLNPKVADRIESNGLPASMNREYENAKPPAPGTDQYAEMMDQEPSKGFIIKEGPIRGGRQDVIRAVRNPETGHLEARQESIVAPKAKEIDDYAKTFGVSKEEATKDLSKPEPTVGPPPRVTPLEADAEKQANMAPKLSAEDKKAIIEKQDNQRTNNKIELKAEKGNIKGAIAEAKGIADERMARFTTADKLASKLDTHDQKLLSERADPNASLERPHNAKDFEKAAKAFDDAYDYSLAADRAGNSSTLRYGNGKYAPLYLNATPEQTDAMKIAPEDRLQGKYTGFRDRTRQYRSYADASKHGLKPLFKSPVEDMRVYARSGNVPISQNLLHTALKRVAPEDVADRGKGFETTKDGKQIPFTQAAGHLPFDVSSKLQDSLRNYKEIAPGSKAAQNVVHVAEKVNKGAKTGLFFGSPFHYENIEKNFRGLTWATGHPIIYIKGMANALRSSLQPGHYDSVIAKARADGTMDYARQNGMEIADINTRHGVGKVNIFGQTHDNMQKYINTIGLQLAKAAKDHGVVSGTKQATDLFDEYNKVLGKVNEAVHGTSPLVSKVVSGGSLAPNYLRSQLALLKDSVKPGEGRGGLPSMFKPGSAARATVVGTRLSTAAMAIIFSSIAQGKMPNFTKMLNEAGLNTNNPNPNFEGGEKKKNGEGQVINFPTDPIGLGVGAITQRQHFLDARTSPALSFAQKVATNTNWNGEPLADPTKPNYLVNKVKNAAINSLVPIGVQNFTNLTKNTANPNIRQGLLQEIGGRLKANPNDPQYKSAMQYFNMQTSVLKSVPPGSKDESVLNSYFARNTNGQGQKIKPGTVGGYSSAKDLVTNYNQGGSALQSLYKGQHSLKGNDPLWSLPLSAPAGKPSVLNYLTYQSQYEGPEKTGTKEKMEGNPPVGQEGWIDKLTAARNTYYNKLPAGSDAAAKEPAYPTFSRQTNADLTTAYKITSSTQYDNFIDSHPDVVDAQGAITAWQNKIRLLEGAPTSIYQAAKASPQLEQVISYYNSLPASKSGGNTNAATNKERSNWINANPQLYSQMAQFYAQDDVADTLKDSIEATYSGQYGKSQALLKAAKNTGSDVAENTNGQYSLNAAVASTQTYSSDSSDDDDEDKQYKIDIAPIYPVKVYVHHPYGGTASKVPVRPFYNPLKYSKVKTYSKVPIGQAVPANPPKGATNIAVYSG